MPANRTMEARRIAEAVMRIEQDIERKATDEEIGAEVRMNPEDVRKVMNSIIRQGSIDAPIDESGNSTKLSDVIEDKTLLDPVERLEKMSLCEEIEHVLSRVNEKEEKIIRMFFGLNGAYPMSLEDIGKELGVSKERVRQIRDKTIRRLRFSAVSEQLKSYL